MDKIITIGIIDDKVDLLLKIEEKVLQYDNYQVFIGVKPNLAKLWVETEKIDMLVSDKNLEIDTDGLHLLKEIRLGYPDFPLVLFSSSGLTPKELNECKVHNIDFFDRVIGEENIVKNILAKLKNSRLLKPKAIENKMPIKQQQSKSYASKVFENLRKEAIENLKDEKNENYTITSLGDSTGTLTTAQLINEIENNTPLGEEYVYYWSKLKSRILKNKNKKRSLFKRIFSK